MSTKRVRKIIGINLQQKKKMGPGLDGLLPKALFYDLHRAK
jgi:hypothetical protein